jgi:hypothetical protein
MDWKKIVPIAVMAMMVFAFTTHTVSAASTTGIKAYAYNPYDPPGNELGKDMYLKTGESLDIAVTPHLDGGNPQWFRCLQSKSTI